MARLPPSISSYCVLHNQKEGDSVTITPSSAFLSLHTYVPAYHCTACARLSPHSWCAPITAQLVRAYHCTACARLSLHAQAVSAYHFTACVRLSLHSLCAHITAQLVRASSSAQLVCASSSAQLVRASSSAQLVRAYHCTACARPISKQSLLIYRPARFRQHSLVSCPLQFRFSNWRLSFQCKVRPICLPNSFDPFQCLRESVRFSDFNRRWQLY